jgi:hypothetical protein
MDRHLDWTKGDDRATAQMVPDSVLDFARAAEKLGIELSEGEMGAVLAHAFEDLGERSSSMNPGAVRDAMSRRIPFELQRVARGHAVADDC